MEQAWKQLSQWIAEDKLQPVIGHIVAANEAAKGYELLMARKNFGKVVLKIA
jgi:NADPH:quinone reductase-like Zn-dependent oxidoreductase